MLPRLAGFVLVSLATALSSSAQVTVTGCIDDIKNQAWPTTGPKCLKASAEPTLGLLYPISQKWFVSPSGKLGFGTTTPAFDAEFKNGDGSSTSLAISGSNTNASFLALNNTDSVGHNYALASWGLLAGGGGFPGPLQGSFSIFDVTSGIHRMIIDANGNVGIGASVYAPATALDVAGTITGAMKNFRIDHPLDPANKTLTHACIESSEMINIYRGNVVLDGFGEGQVEMPTWFEALNADFSYQLTAIGAPAPGLYVAEELSDGEFRIAGGSPGMKVSWQVTGARQDAYALAHPLVVEQDKGVARGTLLYPKEQEAVVLTPR